MYYGEGGTSSVYSSLYEIINTRIMTMTAHYTVQAENTTKFPINCQSSNPQ